MILVNSNSMLYKAQTKENYKKIYKRVNSMLLSTPIGTKYNQYLEVYTAHL